MTSGDGQRLSVMRGILRVARGRPDGVACFGQTSQSFLASLAPLLAFPLVGTALGLFTEGVVSSLTEFAMYICALLTPAVLSFELARWWGCESRWLRFATAFNWCEWILPVVGCLIMIPVSVGISIGLEARAAGIILLAGLGIYGLWLHWFLAHHALSLSKLRAVIMVVLVNTATVTVASLPRLLTVHVS